MCQARQRVRWRRLVIVCGKLSDPRAVTDCSLSNGYIHIYIVYITCGGYEHWYIYLYAHGIKKKKEEGYILQHFVLRIRDSYPHNTVTTLYYTKACCCYYYQSVLSITCFCAACFCVGLTLHMFFCTPQAGFFKLALLFHFFRRNDAEVDEN